MEVEAGRGALPRWGSGTVCHRRRAFKAAHGDSPTFRLATFGGLKDEAVARREVGNADEALLERQAVDEALYAKWGSGTAAVLPKARQAWNGCGGVWGAS